MLGDYDFTIHYHLRKANVVADALNRENHGQLSRLWVKEFEMHEVNWDFEMCLGREKQGPCLYNMPTRRIIIQRVVEEQVNDGFLENVVGYSE